MIFAVAPPPFSRMALRAVGGATPQDDRGGPLHGCGLVTCAMVQPHALGRIRIGRPKGGPPEVAGGTMEGGPCPPDAGSHGQRQPVGACKGERPVRNHISSQPLAPLKYYGCTGLIWRYGDKVVLYVWGEEEHRYTPCFMEVHLVAGA